MDEGIKKFRAHTLTIGEHKANCNSFLVGFDLFDQDAVQGAIGCARDAATSS